MRVHILVNVHRTDAVDAAKQTIEYLRGRQAELATDSEGAPFLDLPGLAPDQVGKADLMVTFGGDGTLLRAAHVCCKHRTPILGVYFGRFGFVTQCDPNEVGAALSLFIDGQAKVTERMMLCTELIRDGRVVASLHSLNEAVVQRSATARMLYFEVKVDGHELTRYPADGVLVATPTGSTAYNLSAGGPICDPNLDAMILTAANPHTLSARPLVLRPNSEIDIRVETRGDVILSCDGQGRLAMISGDHVRVRRSEYHTRLLMVDDADFLVKLKEKLLWSQHVAEGAGLDA